MSRIRANGEPQSEDFAQGAKIYNMQTETLSCLHKLLKESRATAKQLEPLKEGYDLAFTQLAQVQEELEHYYLMSKDQQGIIDQYSVFNNKLMDIIFKLIWICWLIPASSSMSDESSQKKEPVTGSFSS